MISYQRLRNIVIGKLVDHTISDSFESLSEEIFGEGNNFSEAEVRKRMYGMRRMIEVIDNDGVSGVIPDAAEGNIEDRLYQIKKETKRLQDQRREYNKLLASDARFEALCDSVLAAATNLNLERPLNISPCQITTGPEEAVLVLSDWHYGMKTNNIWQVFDTEKCKERVEILGEQTIDKLRLHRPHRLNVLILGDMAHGAIHTSARVASEELVCDQIMHVAEIIAELIASLSEWVDEVFVFSTYGNHLRTVQNKKDSIHADNMEKLIPWWLQCRFSELHNIHIVNYDDNEFVVFPVAGKLVLGTHGDLDGIRSARMLHTLFSKRCGTDIDYIILGDKHHLESFEELGIKTVIVPSLCGTDEYANQKRLYSEPGQILMFFRPEYGLDATYRIKL